MKRASFVLICLTLFIASCTKKAEPFNEMEVKKVLETQEEAWNRGDIEAFMDGYENSDSTRFISKNGVTYGWKKLLDNYKKGYPDIAAMGKLHFNLLHVEPFSDSSAAVTGKWTLTETAKEASGHFLLILKRTEKGWKIAVDCTS